MEFKENLKQLRIQKGLTQAQLAEKLFVSRSTVAKWENGLGLPSPDSMAMLEDFFDISSAELSTKEPEEVIVSKNKKLRIIGEIIFWAIFSVLPIVIILLLVAIHNGEYGFTPQMAAGSYADNEYIDTDDYRIYYFKFGGALEDGRHWSDLQGFKPVKKRLWGCTVSSGDYSMQTPAREDLLNSAVVYYNLIDKSGIYRSEELDSPPIWDIPSELITATTVTVSGVEYELREGFFFTTKEPVRYFKIGDEWVKFYPYWGNQHPVNVNGKECYAVAWQNKDQYLAAVANLSLEDCSLTVALDKKFFSGKVKVIDAETQEAVNLHNNTFKVNIPRRNYKLYLIV